MPRCHNSGNREIMFLKPHSLFEALGRSKEERSSAYLKLFEGHIETQDMNLIREA